MESKDNKVIVNALKQSFTTKEDLIKTLKGLNFAQPKVAAERIINLKKVEKKHGINSKKYRQTFINFIRAVGEDLST